LRLYRQVLRDLRTFLRDKHGIAAPGNVRRETAEGFLVALSRKRVSWSWMASAIGVMRNVFDRLGGLAVTTHMVTPRRNWPLPETLSENELRRLLDALPNPRNRLLVALLAGCGLRISEACRIRWADFDRVAGTLRLDDPEGLRSRTVAVPEGLLPLFRGLAVVSLIRSPPNQPAGKPSSCSPVWLLPFRQRSPRGPQESRRAPIRPLAPQFPS
jgi:integrase